MILSYNTKVIGVNINFNLFVYFDLVLTDFIII